MFSTTVNLDTNFQDDFLCHHHTVTLTSAEHLSNASCWTDPSSGNITLLFGSASISVPESSAISLPFPSLTHLYCDTKLLGVHR